MEHFATHILPHVRSYPAPNSVVIIDNCRIHDEMELTAMVDSVGGKVYFLPPYSPDLNPIEMFWGWIRRKLRLMDLADLRLKRRPLGKTAYTLRVKRVMQTQKAQTVAKNFATRFRKACVQVVKRKGAAADN